jgi:uncharacterized protein (DUF1810 family)
MTFSNTSRGSEDPYDLRRFVRAQASDYARALAEIRSGQKRTHWMWYIFPQIDGLAFSSISQHYSIKSVEEAKARKRSSAWRADPSRTSSGLPTT